ncbi:MAG TPA: carbon-nitrogen hydrolase family protein [Microlunatus sp.]|nr:carbon-nitrogen hydrolase family protein [Microlunatus sp.]
MDRPWVVALVQSPPLTGADPVGTLATEISALCRERPDVSMIVYPEIHLFGGSDLAPDPNAWLADAAEPLDGPRATALAEIAAAHGIWLVPGSLSERDGDAIYNTAVVFAPDGRLVAAYRKVFPWRPYEAWAPGADWVTFDVPEIGRFGLSICFDSWFPESTRQLGWLGADIILNLVKTVGEDRAQEVVLAQANAIVNQVYFLSVNAAGPVGAGRSVYVDPDGRVIAECPDAAPAVTIVEIDPDKVREVREHGTVGLNRLGNQIWAGDTPIRLPAYDGTMDPLRRAPDSAADPGAPRSHDAPTGGG